MTATGGAEAQARALLDLLAPVHVRQVRLTRNRTLLLGLRGDRRQGLRLSLHRDLAVRQALWPDIAAWVASGGHRMSESLRTAIDAVFVAARSEPAALPDLEPLGGPLDLAASLEAVRSTWFPHLSAPAVGWSRRSPVGRTRRQIRFACYRRHPPTIQVNPLVDQPWVARRFVEFLLFHELCHHAQACRPVKGETPHSARFRAWERRYPHHAEATAWERASLPRFLAS